MIYIEYYTTSDSNKSIYITYGVMLCVTTMFHE